VPVPTFFQERGEAFERNNDTTRDGKHFLGVVAERDLYQWVLEPEFHILTAARGLEGAALAATYHPDAIVLDVPRKD